MGDTIEQMSQSADARKAEKAKADFKANLAAGGATVYEDLTQGPKPKEIITKIPKIRVPDATAQKKETITL